MEYKILYATDYNSLSRLVNEELRKGWKPQGGVSGDKYGFCQAVVKSDGK
ncbi:hypothetical protein [Leeuwenhoekiella sp. NPDC079379]